VVSERGTVYLMGLVTRQEGTTAADATSKVMGVQQVVKVYQYIQPGQGSGASAVAAVSAPASAASVADQPTVGAVPDATVSSRPIEQQAPAPVMSAPDSGNAM
jgi:hypothetical protein